MMELRRTANALVLAGAASAGLCLVTPAQAVSLVNGSLTGPTSNGGVPTGWTTLQDSPDTNDIGNNTGLPYYGFGATPSASPDGGTWVGMGANASANFFERFGQTVGGLTVGASYTVSWQASNFGWLAPGGPAGNFVAPGRINVFIDGSSIGLGTALALQPGWLAESMTFTATAVTHQLAFSAVSLGNRSYVGIDGISLAAATPVPEPAAAWLMLAGLGGLAAVSRRRACARPPAPPAR